MGGIVYGPGMVYTETLVFSAPEAHQKDAPYQLAIIALDAGGKTTARVLGERVHIGDRVDFVELRDGIPYFRRSPKG